MANYCPSLRSASVEHYQPAHSMQPYPERAVGTYQQSIQQAYATI
ncbi:hypothetical protein [Spirosoma fluminis]